MTGDNVRACLPDGKCHDPKFTEMLSARRAFFVAWRKWLALNPSQVAVSQEHRATIEVMRQIVELEGS